MGWAVDISWLKSVLVMPGFVAMNPATAITFIIAGAALVLLRNEATTVRYRCGQACAWGVVAVGLLSVARFVIGWDIGLDQVLFESRLGGNRMAPNTAAAFLFSGLALVSIDCVVCRRRPSEWLALPMATASLMAIVGYSYGATAVYGIGPFIPMALNTAALFGTLAAGILMARSQAGLLATIYSRSAGGQMARRLLPAAALIPLLLGWLRLLGEWAGMYGPAFGVTLTVSLTVVLFAGVIYWAARALNQADAARQQAVEALEASVKETERAEQAVRRFNAELDQRVQTRTAELAESEARFQSFMDNSPALAFMKDDQGRLVYVNRRFGELLPHDWRQKQDAELWPEAVARQIQSNDQQVLDADCSIEFVEELCFPEQAVTSWLTYKFPIRDSGGRRFLGGVAVDITERKRVEEALRQRDEQLRHSQKMEAIGTLAGGVAHEFNNLLQAVQGYTQYAMEGMAADEQPYQDLQQVLKAAERAATLTRQLLGFGRRQMLEFVDLDANQLVQDVVKLLRPLIGEHVELNLVLGPSAGTVHADATQLQQLLMNLCVNARDAMPTGGHLLVKTEHLVLDGGYCELHADVQPGRYTVLTVGDSGCGISRENIQHIFEPFFTTKEVGKGTGLGLATVYGVVQQHKGTVRVYSELGIGTTFRVYLPSTENTIALEEQRPPDPRASGVELILVAEDEPLVRNLAVRILQGAGYQTLVARDGEEALQLFKTRESEISLALLDVVMPK
ncbi:MAG TPA: ATP-binding protein, partial [Pirellulales bacterium]